MRVALFTGNYDLVVDGVSLTLNRWVRYLESKGHQVLIFAPTHDAPERRRSGSFVPAPSVPIPGRGEYRVAGPLRPVHRKTLESFDPHLVHLATPDVLGSSAQIWARDRGTPVVATYHTHFPAYLKHYGLGVFEPLLRAYLRRFYSRCTEVYVPAPPLMRFLRETRVSSVLRLWGRGVDTDRFNPSRRSESWRRRQGVLPGQVLITFVGRLVKEKGVMVFSEVIKRLQESKLPVQGMIVGDGPLLDALKRELPGAVFPGFLEGEELARAYASSDVFLYPSDSEAFGNVIVEAMASALPVVCADSPAGNSHVDAGKTGFLAPPANAEAFFRWTRRLVREPDLRFRIGRAARGRASSYSWERTLATLLSYYHDVLAESKGRDDVPTVAPRSTDLAADEWPRLSTLSDGVEPSSSLRLP